MNPTAMEHDRPRARSAAAALANAEQPTQALHDYFSRWRSILGADVLFHFLIDRELTSLVLMTCLGINDEQHDSFRRLAVRDAFCGQAALSRNNVTVSKLQESDDPRAALFKAHGIRAYTGYPVTIEDRVIGTLAFASTTSDVLDDDVVATCGLVAESLAHAYARLRHSPPQALSIPHGPKRVLVVDDNPTTSTMLARLIEKALGHTAQTVHRGSDVLEVARESRPHAVLLDLGMPEVDGFQVARLIRQQPWGRSMLIIALTGWSTDWHRERAREAGFDHFLVKPVWAEQLGSLLSESEGAAQFADDASSPPELGS